MLKKTAGDDIRHERWRQDLSVEGLAERASVSPATIIKLEKGEQNVRGQKVYAVANALGLDPAGLFEAEVAT